MRDQIGGSNEFARASEGYRTVIEDLSRNGLIDRCISHQCPAERL